MRINTTAPSLFLYGSLLTGTPDRRINRQMRRLLRHARSATIQARLYNLGRYPGVVVSASTTDQVHGRVITVNSSRFLQKIDRYEGYFAAQPADSEFIRILMSTRLLPSRKKIGCWVYVYNGGINGKQRIISGNYVRHKKLSRRKW